MKNSFAFLYCLLMTFAVVAQSSGNVNLGSEITNGVMTDGCISSCSPTYCTQTGDNSGNHAVETIELTISGIPSSNSVEVTFTSVLCGSSSGLDGGDDIYIDGTKVYDGSGNATVNLTECVEGGSDIQIEFRVNRRDEIINVSWDSGATDPGAPCFMVVAPVNLVSFDAKAENGMSKLTWTTLSELNNDRFLIQHSTNGIDFKNVGKVLGHGTTNRPMNYEFYHKDVTNGTNYYKIKQVDFDGSMTVTNVKSIEHHNEKSLRITPTISSDYITISISQKTNGNIYDLNGKHVAEITLDGDTKFDVRNLEKGVYVVHTQVNQELFSRRFIVE